MIVFAQMDLSQNMISVYFLKVTNVSRYEYLLRDFDSISFLMLFFWFETVEILLKPAYPKQKAMLTIEHVFGSRKKLMKPLFISLCSS